MDFTQRRTRWGSWDVLTDSVAIVFLNSVFLTLCYRYWWYTIDDAFITFRYAKHVAAGYGATWNVGADPVEGFTSMLWMLTTTVPHVLGIDAVSFAKVVGLVAGVLLVNGTYAFGRQWNGSPVPTTAICSLLACSPAVAVLTVQGLETPLAMLFVFCSCTLSLLLASSFTDERVLLLGVVTTLGMFTRPELVVFSGVLLGSLFVLLYFDDDVGPHAARKYLGYLFVSVFLPGILFVAVRNQYFGHVFPNSFYIKESASLVSSRGVATVKSFLLRFVLPGVVAVVGFRAVLRLQPEKRLTNAAPIVASLLAFLPVWFFIDPIQGYLWRFQMPALPAVVVLVLYLSPRWNPLRGTSTADGLRLVMALLLVAGLVVVPVTTLSEADRETEIRDPSDRIEAGKALSTVDGSPTLFVSEAGAVPYYSEWYAVDWLGLNSEYIAHDGLDREFLRKLDPDLVMVLVRAGEGSLTRRKPILAEYVADEAYEIVAAVEKSGPLEKYHLYLADPESDSYEDVSCTLTTMDGVEYASHEAFAEATRDGISAANRSSADCS